MFGKIRVGIVAKKVGMTQIFDKSGKVMAVTLLQADDNIVVSHKTESRDGYDALVVGYGAANAKNINKPMKGLCVKSGVDSVSALKEFRVKKDAMIPIGSRLSISHFVEGQVVDVSGITSGKGFAGGMKRWNFRGLEATHGVSVTHRSHGSTGNRQDPGKTFKGKKMAGHLGVEKVTVQNLKIVKLDMELGLIAVYGAVPGKKGSYVVLTDAVKLGLPAAAPFPAAIVSSNKDSE